jgi:uncharacterized protein YhhL (DUF1145 family)
MWQWVVLPFLGRGMRSPRAWIFDGVLIVWVTVLPNLIWSKSFFIRTRLSYVRVIMVFMHVSLVKLLRQTVMGRIPALEYMLSRAHVLLRPCLILQGNKCYRFPMPQYW